MLSRPAPNLDALVSVYGPIVHATQVRDQTTDTTELHIGIRLSKKLVLTDEIAVDPQRVAHEIERTVQALFDRVLAESSLGQQVRDTQRRIRETWAAEVRPILLATGLGAGIVDQIIDHLKEKTK